MNYQEAMSFINSIPRFSPTSIVNGTATYDLVAVRELLRRLGNPQNSLKFVHIAGTNGKGSTSAFLFQILVESGLKTGLYTSPFLERFTERIRVSQKSSSDEISEEALARLTETVKNAADSMDSDGLPYPSEFEIVCAIAFLYFAEENCDIVVLEVGLGGRLDATNVISCPELALIATISLDHTEILGNSLPEIAFEKAGIIKEGCQVILYPQDPEVTAVFQRVCKERAATLYEAVMPDRLLSQNLEGQSFHLTLPVRKGTGSNERGSSASANDSDLSLSANESNSAKDMASASGNSSISSGNGSDPCENSFEFPELTIRLLGEYQTRNAALAVNAALHLMEKGWPVTEDSIRRGLLTATWPGRFELVRNNPTVILDGGHNEEGAKALLNSLRLYFPNREIIFVTGVLADKAYKKMTGTLIPVARKFFTVSPNSPRALASEALARHLQEQGVEAIACESVPAAVKAALAEAGRDGIVCVFGSLYLIGEARGLFR
ncbi:MAG: bifunctional folylpolyglutamate synthase/dihydrofolate synthase [Lachnospiraceae bacterium]|nr:bifunctional folylpolyglutamate synthase/dihydrofolate synthase [Lachnospiraceae bacterium]